MANYYRGDQPHLPRQELKHSRPKGSRNGVSTNPNYKPVGHLAKGILRNGRYFYDYVTGGNVNKARRSMNTANETLYKMNRYGGASSSALNSVREQAKKRQSEYVNARSLGRDLANAKKNAGNWLRDRGNNIAGVAKNARDYVSNTARDVRSGQAKRNVSNWLNDRKSDANKWLKDRKREVGNLWDGKAGSGSGKSERDRYIDLAIRAAKKGETQKAIAYSQAAKRLNQQYEKSIAGRAEKLGITNAINKVSKWGSARKKNVEDFIDSITGKTAKRKAEAHAAVEASRKVHAKNLVEGYNRNKSRAKKAKLTSDLEKERNNVYVQKPGTEKYLPQNLYKKKKVNYSKKYKA